MGRKEEAAVPFSRGSWVPVYHNVALAEIYFHTKWRLHPSSRLAVIYRNRKLVDCAPFGAGVQLRLTKRRLG